MKKLIYVLPLVFLMSCAQVFNEMVLPNQCKKCEVVNTLTGEVLWSEQGCGGDNTRLEEQAKIVAYDESRLGNIGDVEVRCETWKKEEVEEVN